MKELHACSIGCKGNVGSGHACGFKDSSKVLRVKATTCSKEVPQKINCNYLFNFSNHFQNILFYLDYKTLICLFVSFYAFYLIFKLFLTEMYCFQCLCSLFSLFTFLLWSQVVRFGELGFESFCIEDLSF